MAIRNRPKGGGVGAVKSQVQRKLMKTGDPNAKPAGVKTLKAARAAAAAVTLKRNRLKLPVVVPSDNDTPAFLRKAARARTGGIHGTNHA